MLESEYTDECIVAVISPHVGERYAYEDGYFLHEDSVCIEHPHE